METNAATVGTDWKGAVWPQFGAAIDMLENAVRACPDGLWGDRSRFPEYWYLVYHTLFFLDFYLSESREGFAPPPPFNLDELDPAGILPERVYTKEEMLAYLEYGRRKCRGRIEGLSAEQARRISDLCRTELSVAELILYSMRHVQHHTAQLNLLLRQNVDDAPRWVARAKGL